MSIGNAKFDYRAHLISLRSSAYSFIPAVILLLIVLSIEFVRSSGSLILRLVLSRSNISVTDFKSILFVHDVIFETSWSVVSEFFEIIADNANLSALFPDLLRSKFNYILTQSWR